MPSLGDCSWAGTCSKGTLYFLVQTLPSFGVVPVLVDKHGKEIEGETEGYLVRIICDM